MTVRLNKFIRDQILDLMLTHAFGAREKELDKEKYALGNAIYEDVYPEETRKLMESLPGGFLASVGSLKIQFDGRNFTHVHFGEKRRVAYHHQYNAAKAYDGKHPLSKRLTAYQKAKDQLSSERANAKVDARAVLDSVTTVKKLMEVWPECAEFARPFAAESPSRAVALPIKELNKALGLPPKVSK